MNIILSILITIASILLIGVILIQKSKGGGLAANVNNYNQFMGVRKTTDFIEKATWGLAAFICVLSIISAFFAPRMTQGENQQLQRLPQTETQAPNFGTPAQGEAAAPAATPAQGEAAAPAAAPAQGKAAAPAAAPAQGKAAAPAAEGK